MKPPQCSDIDEPYMATVLVLERPAVVGPSPAHSLPKVGAADELFVAPTFTRRSVLRVAVHSCSDPAQPPLCQTKGGYGPLQCKESEIHLQA